ncbi:S1C family serine protease [Piscinibacter sakaiensis]|uniref:S1C family serine protease n=1 Tax=Piscinibacter sakaiensis TaxID=1547922 RepID=UPI003F75B4FB
MPTGWRARLARRERWFWAVGLVVVAALALHGALRPAAPAPYTPKQIDAMVRQSLGENPLPSHASHAYEAVRGSVVRVVGLMTEGDEGDDPAPSAPGAVPANGERPAARPGERSVERGVGTGVVIVDNGTILTNLHVVQGARRIKVTFADGHVSDARVINVQPENDLAVLRARSIPDDLEAATMRSTADLLPGDEVIAVGYPFGIGPSVSAGVVSGLKREFNSPDGQQKLSNLIQFDAAANPGNSGGPLVTTDGAVVGIVTAILNPSRSRTFIGIGFAVPIENAAAGAGMPPF